MLEERCTAIPAFAQMHQQRAGATIAAHCHAHGRAPPQAQLEPKAEQIHPSLRESQLPTPGQDKNKKCTGDQVKVPDSLKGYGGMNKDNLRVCYNYNLPHGCSNGSTRKMDTPVVAKGSMNVSNVEADTPCWCVQRDDKHLPLSPHLRQKLFVRRFFAAKPSSRRDYVPGDSRSFQLIM